jgi:hypothetical protein
MEFATFSKNVNTFNHKSAISKMCSRRHSAEKVNPKWINTFEFAASHSIACCRLPFDIITCQMRQRLARAASLLDDNRQKRSWFAISIYHELGFGLIFALLTQERDNR